MSQLPEREDDDRVSDLFVTALLFGLTHDEQREYLALQVESSGDVESLADVVSFLDSKSSELHSMSLPDHLRAKIRSAATFELSRPLLLSQELDASGGRSSRSRRRPWAIGVAAGLLLAFVLTGGVIVQRWRSRPDPAELRSDLIATATDLVRIDWADGPTPIPGATGDVVWSPSLQQGFMRFRGLPVNRPNAEQYQLWVFDRNQDEKTPIDGGVFDIPDAGDQIIPIRPKLQVQDAYLFAVTVEKPGGVVVSSRERLPLLAAVK